jgi:DNA-binding FadR family transcriptional regulator
MAKRNGNHMASSAASAVRSVAQKIRDDVLTLKDGQLIGSEDDLVARYGVSRPTLRQATSILVQEQLVSIRRGVGGGYFARVPNTRGVAQSAAVYLLAHGTSMQEIIAAVAPIKAELAVLASQSDDTELHDKLVEFSQTAVLDEEDLYRSFLRSERSFSRILGALSQNKVLTLFLNILYDFCAQVPADRDVYRNHPERIRAYWTARTGMVRAILARDSQIAAVYANRCAEMVAQWMSVDLGEEVTPLPEIIALDQARARGAEGVLDPVLGASAVPLEGAGAAEPERKVSAT